MSYRCGIGPGIPGLQPGAPTITCDGPDCGVKFEVKGRGIGSVPPAWFLDGKPVPGWKGGRTKEGTRVDFCPKCKVVYRVTIERARRAADRVLGREAGRRALSGTEPK